MTMMGFVNTCTLSDCADCLQLDDEGEEDDDDRPHRMTRRRRRRRRRCIYIDDYRSAVFLAIVARGRGDGHLADPTYYYSGIAVTKKLLRFTPHIDHRDRNFQYAISFMTNNAVDDDDDDDGVPTTSMAGGGGGGGELCFNGTDNDGNEVIHVVTTLNRIDCH
jgi:hypothetical protein